MIGGSNGLLPLKNEKMKVMMKNRNTNGISLM
jgi:hypothetical protein